jgi:hypothetical protein
MLMSALIRSEAWTFARSGKKNVLRAQTRQEVSERPRGRYHALSEALKWAFSSA